MAIIPRRSALFVPGDNRRALDKAASLAADVIIIDLEDAVAPADKSQARDNAGALLGHSAGWLCRERVLRINGVDTPWWQDDLSLAASIDSLHAVLLPKVSDPETVLQAADILAATANKSPGLWIMCEDAVGVLSLQSVLQATAQLVQVVVVGTSDLSTSLRLPPGNQRQGLHFALAHCVLSARAAAVDILDGVCLQLGDPQAFQSVCEQGRTLGFDGKTLIHPEQIATANAIFSPTDEQRVHAEKVIAAWRDNRQQGRGVRVVDGQLVEELHLREAQYILQLCDIIQRKNVIN